MTYGTARQATRAAKAAAVILTAVSCSVYDASLLGGGPAEGGNGGANSTAGHSASGGEGPAAGRSGSAGTVNGGANGADAGDAGMMDTAGTVDTGGAPSEGGTSGIGASAGKGGSAGSTGGTGNGGTGGAGTGGTSAGSGGNGTAGSGGTVGGGGTAGSSGGSAGAGGTAPTGCAKLTVPLDANTDKAHFVISLTSAADMSAATVTMRVYVQAGAAGTISNYVQNNGTPNFNFYANTAPTALKSLTGWQTVTFAVATQSTGGSKTEIRRIGIEINAAPDTTGWSNPTVVYIDSITVTTPALSFPFDSSSTITATGTTSDVSGQVLWPNNGSQDTSASNVVLGWQQTCP